MSCVGKADDETRQPIENRLKARENYLAVAEAYSAFGEGRMKILSQRYRDGPCGYLFTQNRDLTIRDVLNDPSRPLIQYYCLERI